MHVISRDDCQRRRAHGMLYLFFAGGIFEFEFLNFKFLSQDPQYQIETMRRFGGVAGRNWDPPGKATDNENKTRPTSPRPSPANEITDKILPRTPTPAEKQMLDPSMASFAKYKALYSLPI